MGLSWLTKSIGYHVIYDEGIADAIDYASKNGFTSIQVDLNLPKFFPEKYGSGERARIKDETSEKNVVITLHAPELDLQSLHPGVLRAVILRLEEIMEFARDVGARSMTVHPGPVQSFNIAGEAPQRVTEMYLGLYREMFGDALRELADYSHGEPFFCMENKAYTRTLMEILGDVMRTDDLYLTWDLAKMYRGDGTVMADVEEFHLASLDRVRECHLQDVNARGQHQLVGTGFVDFKKYVPLLRGRDVNYTIEVRPRELALRSLETLNALLS